MQLDNSSKEASPNTSNNKTNKFKKISGGLAAASCALFGTSNVQANSELDAWKFDTALLIYSEVDRVSAAEGVVSADKSFEDDKKLSLKFVFDTLTGASANGAVAQPYVQTFSRPSGKGQFDVKSGVTPLDDTFRDTRVQGNGSWSQPLNDEYDVSVGAHFSKEYDYLSLGVNAGISRDFNQQNTTLSAAFSYSADSIFPEGGRPLEFGSYAEFTGNPGQQNIQFNQEKQKGDGSKDTLDLLVGVTQVINKNTLMQFNYSYSYSDGYHTDPFKMLSILDSQGYTQSLIYEKRPEERLKHNVFVRGKYYNSGDILDLSYRYMQDDWKITSHTIDFRYRMPIAGAAIEPHIRWYQQQAAEFYQPYMLETQVQPEFASSDYRLGEMEAITVGVKYIDKMDNGNEYGLRFEYYLQSNKNAGYEAIGVLNEVEYLPDVSAVIVQFSYSF